MGGRIGCVRDSKKVSKLWSVIVAHVMKGKNIIHKKRNP